MRCSDGSALGNSWRCGLCAEYQEQAEPWQIYSGILGPMPRGNRLLIFASAIGLAFLGFGLGEYGTALNYADKERQQPYRYASDKPAEVDEAAAGQTNTQPFEYRTPCENPKGHDESDLCAQWRAAQAAENSALWTKWGFWIAIFGTLGLYWQIVLTRKAVEDTGSATKAMLDSNKIAREGIVSNNRAWLSVEAAINSTLVIDENAPELRISILLTVHNSGGAPATNIDIGAELVMGMAFELGAKQREVAKRSYETGEGGWFPNVTMVPGQTLPWLWSLVTSGGAVEESRLRAKEFDSGAVILPVGVVGCVQYRLPGSPTLHQTGFAYQIELIPTATWGQVILEKSLPIEANRLRLAIPIGGTGLVD